MTRIHRWLITPTVEPTPSDFGRLALSPTLSLLKLTDISYNSVNI